jgi:hypothetical protein
MPLSKGATSVIVAVITAFGTIATAWVTSWKGYTTFPNPGLEQEVKKLKGQLENRSTLAGDFEWQWAGDNWLGSLKFTNLANGTISARTEMRAVTADPQTQGRTYLDRPAFHSEVDGSVTMNGNSGFILHLPIAVSAEYLKKHHTHSRVVMLDGELKPVDAFAGKIRYLGDEGGLGDIILVRYGSNLRRW